MKKLNILHITYDMGIGGTEQVIRNLIESTDLDRFTPSVVCLDNTIGPLGVKLQEQGYSVISFDRKPGLDFNLIKAIRHHIKQNDVDIIHCHQYTPYSYGVLASIFTGVKIIFTEHGRFYPDTFKWKRMLINPALSLCTDAIISISSATKDALIKFEFLPKNKISIIYNGVADFSQKQIDNSLLQQELGLQDDDLVLGTISRLDPIKNQVLLLDAFKEISKEHRNTKLLIIGDGPLREELEAHAKTIGVIDRTIFTGFQVDPQRYLKLMDVFLLPSLSEGTSMTLLEAMSFSKPCVVTNAGGNPEIVLDDETGFVTPNRDMPAFAAGVLKLLNNKELRLKMGVNARKRYMDSFSVENMTNMYQDLYVRVHPNH